MGPSDSAFGFSLDDLALPEGMAAIEKACDAVEQSSIDGAKAESFFTARWFISLLQYIHNHNVEWWVSLFFLNFGVRLLTFPLMIFSQIQSAKMVEINHNMLKARSLQAAAMKAQTQEEHARLMAAFKAEFERVTKKYGSPQKTAALLPVATIPQGIIFFSVFSSVFNLARHKPPSMVTGGTLWFPDLTIPDPYFGLPVLCAAAAVATVEFGTMNNELTPIKPAMKWFFRACCLLFIPFGAYTPSATCVLWVANSLFSVISAALLRNDKFRVVVGLKTMAELRQHQEEVRSATLDSRKRLETAAAGTAPTQDVLLSKPKLYTFNPKNAKKK